MKVFRSLLLASILLFHTAGLAAAHPGAPIAPHDLWVAWRLDPAIVSGLALALWRYNLGLLTLWRRAGVGRGARYSQVIAFHAGLLALFVALVSPLDALSSVLLSGHMVQHLLLIVVAAPLLVWSAPAYVCLWSTPRSVRVPFARWWRRQAVPRTLWRVLTAPLAAWLLHAAVLWVWHAPLFYQAALDRPMVHLLEHASFFVTALLFWWVLLQPYDRRGLHCGIGMLMAFTTALHSGLLGMLLTFSTTPWYSGYQLTTRLWGLTPLEDQQLAGVIMWAPGGFIYLAATLALLAAWLAASERAVRLPHDAGHGVALLANNTKLEVMEHTYNRDHVGAGSAHPDDLCASQRAANI